MDVSKQYINMCEKAQEIQEYKKIEDLMYLMNGDFAIIDDSGDIYIKGGFDNSLCRVLGKIETFEQD